MDYVDYNMKYIQLIDNTSENLSMLKDFKNREKYIAECVNSICVQLGLSNEWHQIINLGRTTGDGYNTQIAIRIGNSGLFFRTSDSNGWHNWATINWSVIPIT